MKRTLWHVRYNAEARVGVFEQIAECSPTCCVLRVPDISEEECRALGRSIRELGAQIVHIVTLDQPQRWGARGPKETEGLKDLKDLKEVERT
jgi:hypothetical protein